MPIPLIFPNGNFNQNIFNVQWDLYFNIHSYSNLDDYGWMNYDRFNHNVLNYYAECNMLDGDPSQKDYSLIDGLDLLTLRKNKSYKLNDDQMDQIIKQIFLDVKKNSLAKGEGVKELLE